MSEEVNNEVSGVTENQDASFDESIIIGETLRSKREALDISVEEIAEKLNIAPKQIVALEENNFTLIPNAVFCQGYLRSYAGLLGLDPEPLVQVLNKSLNVKSMRPRQVEADGKLTAKPMMRQNHQNLKRYALLLLPFVVLFTAYKLFGSSGAPVEEVDLNAEVNVELYGSSEDDGTKSVTNGLSLNAGSDSVTSASNTVYTGEVNSIINDSKAVDSPSVTLDEVVKANVENIDANGSAILALNFTKETWVEVYDANNKRLVYSTKKVGEEVNIKGASPFYVKLGLPSSANITFNGNDVAIKTNTTNSPISFVLE